jgi:uncharacterized membrane protein YfcA
LDSALFVFFFIVLLANAVEVVAGFGSVILAITFGAYFFSVQQLVPVLVILNIALGIILTGKYFKEINFKKLFGKILLGTALGLPIGIYLFRVAPVQIVKPLLGGLVFFLAAYELWLSFWQKQSKAKPLPLTKEKAWFFLFTGGIVQGLYASGGPLVVYFSVREFENKSEMRSTLAGLWLILNLVLAFSLINDRKITHEALNMAAVLAPAVLLGFVFGDTIHKHVSEKIFRTSVYVLLLLAGLGLIFLS